MGITKDNSILGRNSKETIGYSEWEDKGCAISDACLECPLPMCKHDNQFWYDKYLNLSKHRNLIHDLKAFKGAPRITDKVQQLATKHNVATRTVFRMKKRLEREVIDIDMIELFYSKLRI